MISERSRIRGRPEKLLPEQQQKKMKAVTVPKENLPTEVWGNILSFLPKEIKTLRAVNKELNVNVAELLKLDRSRVFEFKYITKSILEFIRDNAAKVRIHDNDYLVESDFGKYFKNLEYLSLLSVNKSNGCTDSAMRNLVNLKEFEISGNWPKFDGSTLHLLPELESLTVHNMVRDRKLDIRWDELNDTLKRLKCDESLVDIDGVLSLENATSLDFQFSGTSAQAIDMVVSDRLTELGLTFYTRIFDTINVDLNGNGVNIKRLDLHYKSNDYNLYSRESDENDPAVHDCALFMQENIVNLPNVRNLKCNVASDVDIDLSNCARLEKADFVGIASHKTIQSIHGPLNSISFAVYRLEVADVLAIGDAEIIEITCLEGPDKWWYSEWGPKMNNKQKMHRCKKLTLKNFALGYGYELISKSPELVELVVEGLHFNVNVDENLYSSLEWSNSLGVFGKLKTVHVSHTFFTFSILKYMESLENFKLVSDSEVLKKQRSIFKNQAMYPPLSGILASQKMNKLYISIRFKYTLQELESEMRQQFKLLDDIIDLDSIQIWASCRFMNELILEDLALVYLPILPWCFNLTRLKLDLAISSHRRNDTAFQKMTTLLKTMYLDTSEDLYDIDDRAFKHLTSLESIDIYGVEGITGEFLSNTPKLRELVIGDCKTFDIDNLKRYSKKLPYLNRIRLYSIGDGTPFAGDFKGDEITTEQLKKIFRGTLISVKTQID